MSGRHKHEFFVIYRTEENSSSFDEAICAQCGKNSAETNMWGCRLCPALICNSCAPFQAKAYHWSCVSFAEEVVGRTIAQTVSQLPHLTIEHAGVYNLLAGLESPLMLSANDLTPRGTIGYLAHSFRVGGMGGVFRASSMRLAASFVMNLSEPVVGIVRKRLHLPVIASSLLVNAVRQTILFPINKTAIFLIMDLEKRSFSSALDFFYKVISERGMAALFNGWEINLVHSSCFLASWHLLRYADNYLNRQKLVPLVRRAASGAVLLGATAAIMPLFNVRTVCIYTGLGVRDAFNTIIARDGVRGLFNGLWPRVIAMYLIKERIINSFVEPYFMEFQLRMMEMLQSN